MNTNQTLFESLAIADAEKIHSQVIAWFFNLPDEVLDAKVKLSVLKELFNLSNIEDENIGLIEKCETEVKNIDIFIETKKYVFAIENKLKSSEHTKQTDKYKEWIDEYAKAQQKYGKYGFLSLVGDNPENKDWQIITYEKLHESLNYCLIEIKKEKKEYHLLSDYVETIEKLVNAFKSFKTETEVFKYVFNKKGKNGYSNNEKNKENQNITIIRRNRLKTIFQKAFYRELCNALSLEHFEIDETHGNAQFITHLKRFSFKGKLFKIAFGMQQSTMKISVSPLEYKSSKKEEIKDFDKVFDSFKKVFNKYGNLNNPKTHARLSYSKPLDLKIFEYDFQKLLGILNTEIEGIRTLASEYMSINNFEEVKL